MKKITKILSILAVFALAFSFAGCSSGDNDSSSDDVTISGSGSGGTSSRIPEDFVKIPAVSITGTETWTPESEVFISGRKLEISSFYMSDHEITRAEYKSIVGQIYPNYVIMFDKDGNELADNEAGNNPVTINWYDAIVYCNKRSIKENLTPCYTISGSKNPSDWGNVPTSNDSTWAAVTCDFTANGYRLPTEAEWEWAARGGESYKYAGGDTINDVAWCTGNTYGTRDVKTKKANGYGLYDMTGNVNEWCWDFHDYTISIDTPATGKSSGFIPGTVPMRCLRGGGWHEAIDSFYYIYDRQRYYPYYRDETDNADYGFRVVRTAK
ncbi:SUMF1/EgtB/PvdO family nonheme iron enzyme [uncultured Treponema sp.]|uniref:formylglycine-generating enzyme family protein n=1 Tax=uncultured Treponema sp. TaxID=162155 RepID=UPI0025D91B1B|nr:SUMF1/EgtB/PvdO family nonheme iron enzyme [uncultured Treponema sp.]